MAVARFNNAETDSLAKLAPASDILLASAVVRTQVGRQAARRMVYTFPSLSGAGAINAGVGPVPIVWTIDLVASHGGTGTPLDTAAANLESFLAKIRAYVATSRRYPLVDELGRSKSNVELIDFDELRPPVTTADRQLHAIYRVNFEWMQPA